MTHNRPTLVPTDGTPLAVTNVASIMVIRGPELCAS